MKNIRGLTTSIAAIAASTQALWADTLMVPEDYPTIKFAVEASVPGDTILIGPGEYQEFDLVCESISLVGSIDGNGNPITTINSTGLSRSVILNGTSGSVSNIRFTNVGEAAVDCQDPSVASIYIHNCEFLLSESFGVKYNPETPFLVCDIQIVDSTFDNAGIVIQANSSSDQVDGSLRECIFNGNAESFLACGLAVDGLINDGFHRFRITSYERSVDLKNINYLNTRDYCGGIEFRISSLDNFSGKDDADIRVSNVTGSVSFRIDSELPVLVENVNIEQSCNKFNDDAALSFGGTGELSVKHSTISNNEIGIANNSAFPFILENSIVCGNDVNIDGPYESVGSFVLPNCGSFLGACCLNDQCESVIQEDCDALGGSWRGTNTLCTSFLCAPPVQFGICCINGAAISLFDTDCSKVGGSFFGPGDPEGFACPESCEEDINSDQNVDYEDLISVISAWGPCAG